MTIGALFLTIVLAILTDEILAWSPRLARYLVRLSAKSLPPKLDKRMEEEWLAHMEEVPGKFSRLLFAVGTFRAACVIGHHARLSHIPLRKALLIRAFDLLIGVQNVLLCLPVVLVAIGIMLISTRGRGPIFFRDPRVGRDGKQFFLLRFATIPTSKTSSTLRFLRIDELPQMINVIRGDMSLVGPRPERPYFSKIMQEHIHNYHERFRVRPGLTGYAQVMHPYGATMNDAKKKSELDIEYIKRLSLSLNVRVLLRTAWVVLVGR